MNNSNKKYFNIKKAAAMKKAMEVESIDLSKDEQTADTSARLDTIIDLNENENANYSGLESSSLNVDLTTNSSPCQLDSTSVCLVDDDDDDDDEDAAQSSACCTLDNTSKLQLSATLDTEETESSRNNLNETSAMQNGTPNKISPQPALTHNDTLETSANITKTLEPDSIARNNIFQSTAFDEIGGPTTFSDSKLCESAIEMPEQSITIAESTKGANDSEATVQVAPLDTYTVVTEPTLQDVNASQTTEEQLSEYIPDENSYFQHAFIELGRRLWESSEEAQHYTKGCLWSPDGTCLLVPVHLDGMYLFELPQDLFTARTISSHRELSELPAAVHVKEGGTVYDFIWYPFMDSSAPATCCWLASRQHEPIHMWDAFTGELRCSYRGYDDVDEVESAISVAFTNDGEKVLGGYKKSIKLFDTNIPGPDISSMSVKQAISCFALTTDSNDTVSAGSWNGYIYHYDLRAPKLGALFTLGGHKGGVTWLRYAVLEDGGNNWTLFSGARKDNKILQWDMRNYKKPVREYQRTVSTNQRIYFDLSPHQQSWLVSGDTEGKVRLWDLQRNVGETLPLHGDCCNGVCFHPSYPILATTSGQYHFVDVLNEEDDKPATSGEKSTEELSISQPKDINYENALRLWWIGNCNDLDDN